MPPPGSTIIRRREPDLAPVILRCLFGCGGVDHGADLGDTVGREAALPSVLTHELLAGGDVHAIDLVRGHEALHPLDLRPQPTQHGTRLLGDGLELGLRQLARPRDLPLDDVLRHDSCSLHAITWNRGRGPAPGYASLPEALPLERRDEAISTSAGEDTHEADEFPALLALVVQFVLQLIGRPRPLESLARPDLPVLPLPASLLRSPRLGDARVRPALLRGPGGGGAQQEARHDGPTGLPTTDPETN